LQRRPDLHKKELDDIFLFQILGCLAFALHSYKLDKEEWEQHRQCVDAVLSDGLKIAFRKLN